jgi:glycerol uptake facilitator protein
LSIFLAEVIGTALLILLGNGVVACVLLAQSKGQNSGWIVITFGWGMAVMVGAFTVGQFSGAHLNPAVTIGLAIAGNIKWDKVPEYFAGEFVGAFIGATLVWVAYLDHWKETEDPGLKLACFSTGPAIRNPVANVITEVIGTFVLVLGILAFFAPAKAGGAPPVTVLGALIVGLLVLGIGLSLGGPTGYAINPARDLGPRIMHAILPIAGKGPSDWGYAWIPVVGPLIGAALAAVFFNTAWPSV